VLAIAARDRELFALSRLELVPMSNDDLDTLLELARINDCEPACKPNPEKAFQYYKQAAELGSPYAQYCVGTCYAQGYGVLKDDEEAFKWYFKSARQKPPGFSCAQYAVGLCYQNGRGVPQDDGEAIRWFRKAAELGLAVAQCELAHCYRVGRGTPKDLEAAADWYEKAAEEGDVIAQNNLATCYEHGMGVTQDITRAYTWFLLAADGELESARKALTDLIALMSPTQLESAQWLYREFKEKDPTKQ